MPLQTKRCRSRVARPTISARVASIRARICVVVEVIQRVARDHPVTPTVHPRVERRRAVGTAEDPPAHVVRGKPKHRAVLVERAPPRIHLVDGVFGGHWRFVPAGSAMVGGRPRERGDQRVVEIPQCRPLRLE
jgi:hypothetical protein